MGKATYTPSHAISCGREAIASPVAKRKVWDILANCSSSGVVLAAPPHHNGPHLVSARAEPSGQSHSPLTQTAPHHIYRLAKCHSPQRPPLTSGLRFLASLEIKVGVGGRHYALCLPQVSCGQLRQFPHHSNGL